jgi:hypothetical protein
MYLIDSLFTIEKATYFFFGDHPFQHMHGFVEKPLILSFHEKPLILQFRRTSTLSKHPRYTFKF